MQYRCPQCKSAKIMPVAQGANTPRPEIPKSLMSLIFSIFLLLLLVITSIAMWIFGKGAGTNIQIATIVAFVVTLVSGFFFWRDLPTFKSSMQKFLQSQKAWKCRECNHQWTL